MSTDGENFVVERLPHAAGSDTSRGAAIAARAGAARDFQRIFAYISEQPDGATQDEVTAALDIITQTAVARINDLKRRNWIRDSGYRRKTRTGRQAAILVATAPEVRLPASPQTAKERRQALIAIISRYVRELADVAASRACSAAVLSQRILEIDRQLQQLGD